MIRHGVQKFVGVLPALMMAAAAVAAPGCADQAPTVETVDTVQLNLDFGDGVTLSSVDYVLKGPGTFKRTGTLAVGADPMISATFQNLPAGAYDVVVQGTATDDTSLCKGEVMFNVASMMNAVVQIPLTCSGIAAVTADVNTCPIIDSLSASPAEVYVGSSIQLVAETRDPDNGPSPLSATWAASSGTLTNLSTSGATFTCTAAGTFTIGLRVTDGTPGTKCPDTATISVTCSVSS
ncbi:MAG TPA: hypothetical protein VHJ20_21450 [Polyangia bacterium]|nr:hypothetical protein [Polyangia bacterium]